MSAADAAASVTTLGGTIQRGTPGRAAPMQSRLVEVADNRDGTLSLFTTMLDHAGPLAHGRDLTDPTALAGLARELGANDPQERSHNRRGASDARNVELLVADPPLAFRRAVADGQAGHAEPSQMVSRGSRRAVADGHRGHAEPSQMVRSRRCRCAICDGSPAVDVAICDGSALATSPSATGRR